MSDMKHTMPSASDVEASGRRLVEQGMFEAAVQITHVPMVLSDPNLPDAPLVYVNPAFCKLTGYDPQSSLGRNCRFLQGPDTDPEAIQRIRQAVMERRSLSEEIYNYRRDGSGFWNGLYISPVFDDKGRLIYFFASQIDVSSRREAMRRQVQRVDSMGALASGIAHEFNNLMTVVMGSLERAAAHPVDDFQKRYLDRADWGARRAGQLAGELLSLARRQATEEGMVDLNQVALGFEKTLMQIASPDVRIVLDLSPEPVLARLDLDQLDSVLLNLCRNAADAMPTGGEIRVSTRALPAPEALSLLNSRDAVELSVTDTGQGMLPQVAERATELFFSTKTTSQTTGKGTGLGLFLVLEFVDRSAGRLMIDSQIGRGTNIRLIFPRIAPG